LRALVVGGRKGEPRFGVRNLGFGKRVVEPDEDLPLLNGTALLKGNFGNPASDLIGENDRLVGMQRADGSYVA